MSLFQILPAHSIIVQNEGQPIMTGEELEKNFAVGGEEFTFFKDYETGGLMVRSSRAGSKNRFFCPPGTWGRIH